MPGGGCIAIDCRAAECRVDAMCVEGLPVHGEHYDRGNTWLDREDFPNIERVFGRGERDPATIECGIPKAWEAAQ